MSSCPKKSVTLIELIIAITLVSVIILGINSISIFSHYHLISSDRRAKMQNEVSLVLEHMTKNISRGIGNTFIDGASNIVDTSTIASDVAIRVYIDSDAVGGPGDGRRGTVSDHWIAYRFTGSNGTPNDKYQIWYYSNYNNPSSPHEVIAGKISSFVTSALVNNYVTVTVISRWDPSTTTSQDNPEVTMQATVNLPSVATH